MRFLSAEKGYQCQGCGAEEMSGWIHTIIPGALLMQALAKKMKAERLYISEYGVREGYLWKEFIKTTI